MFLFLIWTLVGYCFIKFNKKDIIKELYCAYFKPDVYIKKCIKSGKYKQSMINDMSKKSINRSLKIGALMSALAYGPYGWYKVVTYKEEK